MNTTIRTQIQEFLDRANRAIGLGESEGEELDVWRNKFSKLNGGIDAPKSWEQMKRIAGTIPSDGREPKVYDVPGDYGQ